MYVVIVVAYRGYTARRKCSSRGSPRSLGAIDARAAAAVNVVNRVSTLYIVLVEATIVLAVTLRVVTKMKNPSVDVRTSPMKATCLGFTFSDDGAVVVLAAATEGIGVASIGVGNA